MKGTDRVGGAVTGGDRGGKEGARAGENEYGVDESLSFPVTVKMLSKLKLVLFWRVGKVPGDCIFFHSL